MKYKCITGGPISENCYLLIDEKTNQAAVVDPGFLNDVLLNEIKKYAVQRILLTHGHFDHIWEADRLHEMLGVPVCAYETEAAFAADDKQNGSLLMMYESITCKRLSKTVRHFRSAKCRSRCCTRPATPRAA